MKGKKKERKQGREKEKIRKKEREESAIQKKEKKKERKERKAYEVHVDRDGIFFGKIFFFLKSQRFFS